MQRAGVALETGYRALQAIDGFGFVAAGRGDGFFVCRRAGSHATGAKNATDDWATNCVPQNPECEMYRQWSVRKAVEGKFHRRGQMPADLGEIPGAGAIVARHSQSLGVVDGVIQAGESHFPAF